MGSIHGQGTEILEAAWRGQIFFLMFLFREVFSMMLTKPLDYLGRVEKYRGFKNRLDHLKLLICNNV